MSAWHYEPPRMQDLGGERFLLMAVRTWERLLAELERSRIKLLVRPSGYLTGLSLAKRNRCLSAPLPLAQANYRFFLDRLRAFRGLEPLFQVEQVGDLVAAD